MLWMKLMKKGGFHCMKLLLSQFNKYLKSFWMVREVKISHKTTRCGRYVIRAKKKLKKKQINKRIDSAAAKIWAKHPMKHLVHVIQTH